MSYTLKGVDKKINACNFLRDHRLKGKPHQNVQEMVEEIIVTAIAAVKTGTMDLVTAEEVCRHAYDEADAMMPLTKALNGELAWKCAERYLKGDVRTNIERAPEAVIDILQSGIEVNVKPSFIIVDREKHELEVISMFFKKPDITQTGTVSGAMQCKGLYSLLYYGKSLVPYLNDPQSNWNVTGSYYYLKLKSDKKGQMDPNFFSSDGKNVISLTDNSQIGTLLDQKFYNQFLNLKAGTTKCYDAAECKNCIHSAVCGYQEPLAPVSTVSSKVNARDIKLSPEQKAVVLAGEGIYRVIACAGSGKTMAMCLRNTNLMYKGVKPEAIYAISFTNAAAKEMSDRTIKYLSDFGVTLSEEDRSKMVSMTFNSLGDKFIKENYEVLGFSEAPNLIEDSEAKDIIHEILTRSEDNKVNDLNYTVFDSSESFVMSGIDQAKKFFDIFTNLGINIKNIDEKMDAICEETWKAEVYRPDPANPENPEPFRESSIKKLYSLFVEYRSEMKDRNLIDYSDQETLLFDLAKKRPEAFENSGLEYLTVDEFQDSNRRQLGIIKLLMKSKTFKSLMVVGDDAQSIYGFRGTSPENFLNFYDLLGVKGKDLYISNNYRSVPNVIAVANGVNKKIAADGGIDKVLKATRPDNNVPVSMKVYEYPAREIDSVAKEIKQKIDAGTTPRDICFIAASKKELTNMADALFELGVPYSFLVPEKLNSNTRVRGACALFEALNNPDDEADLSVYLNTLFRNKWYDNSDADRSAKLSQWVEYVSKFQDFEPEGKYGDFIKLVEKLAPVPDEPEDETFSAFADMLKSKRTWGTTCKYILSFEKYGDTNTHHLVYSYPGVCLTTAHSSKGLEWPVVFATVSKFDSQKLHKKGGKAELQEKYRLMYVVVTRAKDELHLSSTWYNYGLKQDTDYSHLNPFAGLLYKLTGNGSFESEWDRILHPKKSK